MKLYRGYKTEPKFPTPEILQEWEQLQARHREALATKGYRQGDVIGIMGEKTFNRWLELRFELNPQFFTDQEQIAREFAGEKGFVVGLELDDKAAIEHYTGEESMIPGSQQRFSSNFLFLPKELVDYKEEGRITVVSMEKEGKVPPEGISGPEERG